MSENKIVAAKFADNNKTIIPADSKVPERLNIKIATEIGGALERWHTLRNQAIKTPTTDAEIAGLTEFLANQLLTHAPELLGCWYVVRNEYEPLVNVVFNVLGRVDGIRMERARIMQERQQVCPMPSKQCSCDGNSDCDRSKGQ